MKNFALLDNDNIVINIVVVNDEDCGNKDFPESEQIGSQFLNNIFPGIWKEYCNEYTFRVEPASIGGYYDEVEDRFYKQ